MADGMIFWVRPNATDGLTRFTCYQRTSSTTQTFVSSVLNASEFDSAVNLTGYTPRSGYAFVVRDLLNRIGLALKVDGTLLAKLNLIAGNAITITRGSGGSYTIACNAVDASTLYRAVPFGVKDLSGRFVGFLRNGEISAKMPVRVESSFVTDGTVSAWIARDASDHAALYTQDATGTVRKLTAISTPSHPRIVSGKVSVFGRYRGESGFFWGSLAGDAFYRANPFAWYACWGDSLTAGAGASLVPNTTYPGVLSTISGRMALNNGIGGQVSAQIAYRNCGYGGSWVFAGNQIPASGGVVVSSPAVLPFYPNATGTLRAVAGGIPGTLTLAGGVYTFTRRVDGSAVAVANPTNIYPDTLRQDEAINVFWMGQNDGGSSAAILPALAACVANLKTLNKRFVVVGVHGDPLLIAGSAGQTALLASNAAVMAAYPNNYIDMRVVLVAAYNPALPQDVIDHNNNVVPTSLRSDAIHLNDAGYALVAQTIDAFVTSKGWLIA